MITFIRGTLIENWPTRVVVDAGGVGYEILVPLGAGDRLGQMGKEVTVLTHHHTREQEETLYGFSSTDERDLFRLLMDRVSGIGPKMALSILSGMNANDFKMAVVANDASALSAIKGLGKKTAERIILELKDKVGVTQVWEEVANAKGAGASPVFTAQKDALLALISLGYKQTDAQKAVKIVCDANPALILTDDVLRAALRQLQ